MFTRLSLVFVSALPFALFLGCQSDQREDKLVLPQPPTGFLADYWERPIPPQGPPPGHLPDKETNLEPLACAKCHQAQYNDWSKSLHSKAMGPGIMGQLRNYGPHATGEIQSCLNCHAPLTEQTDLLLLSLSGVPLTGSIEGNQPLHESGVVCASCHVRQYKWHGPPRREGLPEPPKDSTLPHDGFITRLEFADSRFCICHQFEADELALEGKLIENTYEEWRLSDYPGKNITCQSCHMPDRRHLFKGIHDAEMTRNGLDIYSAIIDSRPESLTGRFVIKNSGVGHHFPTYVTPRVYMNIFQQDAKGELVSGTFRQMLIARELPVDLSEESFDTRIPAGDSVVLIYDVPRQPTTAKLVFRVWVSPDEFYNRFFEAVLSDNIPTPGRGELEEALANTIASTYLLYESVIALD